MVLWQLRWWVCGEFAGCLYDIVVQASEVSKLQLRPRQRSAASVIDQKIFWNGFLLPHDHTRRIMSRAAKATLFSTSTMAIGIVWFVHWAQKNEKTVCCIFALSRHFSSSFPYLYLSLGSFPAS